MALSINNDAPLVVRPTITQKMLDVGTQVLFDYDCDDGMGRAEAVMAIYIAMRILEEPHDSAGLTREIT